jgi:hypothetical protein
LINFKYKTKKHEKPNENHEEKKSGKAQEEKKLLGVI